MRLRGDLATTSRRAAAVVVAMMTVGAAPALAEITVTTTSDPGAPGDGQCSLREAIALSADCPGQAQSGATTIRVPAGTYTLSDQLTVAGTANLDIRGASTSDPSLTTIRRASDAPQQFRLLHVNAGAVVTLDGLTLTGGRAPDGAQGASAGTNGPNGTNGSAGTPGGAGSPGAAGSSGGGILNNGTLLIDHSVIANNVAGSGGAGRPGGKGGNGGKGTAAGTNDGGVGANGGAGGAGGAGGHGGGILNTGSLTIADSVMDSNVAGASGSGGLGGIGGDGGAGYDVQGDLGNGADAGDGGPGGAMGAAGNGGAIYTVGPASITATTIRFSHGSYAVTSAGAGGAGGNGGDTGATYNGNGGDGGDGGAGGAAAAGGAGGGIYAQGPLTLLRVTMHNNAGGDGTWGGGGGNAGHGGKGGTSTDAANPGIAGTAGTPAAGATGGCGGSGGAVSHAGTTLQITASTLWNNGGGFGGLGGYGGRGGNKGSEGIFPGPSSTAGASGGTGGCGGGGGAVTVFQGSATIINSTIGENRAGSGNQGGNGGLGAPNGATAGGNGGNGGNGGPAGALISSRPLALDAVTFNANLAGSGGAGSPIVGAGNPNGSPGTAGAGGATTALLLVPVATVSLRNTIVRGPGGPPNCGTAGVAVSNQGGNFDYPDGPCPGLPVDPQLDPIGEYGGPTRTYRLHPGSPAIDGGTNTGCQQVDQRGIARPQGAGCDAGAVEIGAPPVCQDVGPVHVPFGKKTNVQLACSDPSGLPIYQYVLTSPFPQHGQSRSMNATGSVMSYDPDPGFSGTDTFGYYGRSGNGDSVPRTVTVQVSAPPAAPQVTGTAPASPASVASPGILGTAPAGTTVTVYPTADCSGAAAGSASAADFAAGGVPVGPLAEGTTVFHALATDADGIASTCSSSSVSYTYVAAVPGGGTPTAPPLGSLPAGTTTGTSAPGVPNTIISRRPKAKVAVRGSRARVVFRFRATIRGATFRCSLDGARPRPCRSPKAYRVKPGRHRFTVRATAGGKTDPTPASFRFRVTRKR